ncbi:MAG: ABC transporter substrate-binding protein [Proteobacteria bacterium]|nr:ABC transporter substrate-binding protein [Pseudomonadota bacterium]MBI3495974.1 ABC transporter substrate-binding protein [Pseudomonadota bacterium]
MTTLLRRLMLTAAPILGVLLLSAPLAAQQKVLKVVPHADLRVLDGYQTTATITAMHMASVYDALFAWDSKFEAKPMMVEAYTVSPDGLKYTMTLRSGLKFHDGTPVTSKDVVASIKRFVQREALGRTLESFMASIEAVNEKTVLLTLKEAFCCATLTLAGINQAGGIYREKEAMTDPATPITETIGSGPFKFVKSEYVPGSRVVYEKNPDYVPRSEKPDGFTGGKVVKVDRVEYTVIPDDTTKFAALVRGEVDLLDQPSLDNVPTIEKNPDIVVETIFNAGVYGMLRPNHLLPPFNNIKARQALALMVDQREYAQAAYGGEQFWKDSTPCFSLWICGTAYGTQAGSEAFQQQNIAKAKQLLAEAGYKGEKITLIGASDIGFLKALTLVTGENLKKVGMNVDLQLMEWGNVVARRGKKDAPEQGGWNIFHTTSGGASQSLPFSALGTLTSCDAAWFGWPCDQEAEKMRQQFLRAAEPAQQKQIADALHKRLWENIIPYVPVGQYNQPTIHRKNVTGLLRASMVVWWNVEKN